MAQVIALSGECRSPRLSSRKQLPHPRPASVSSLHLLSQASPRRCTRSQGWFSFLPHGHRKRVRRCRAQRPCNSRPETYEIEPNLNRWKVRGRKPPGHWQPWRSGRSPSPSQRHP